MTQTLLVIMDGTVTIQTAEKTYTDTLANFEADGGILPVTFQTVDYCRDTRSCLIDGEPMDFPDDVPPYVENVIRNIDALMSKKAIRDKAIEDAKSEADQKKMDEEVEMAEQERIAAMTLEEVRAEKLKAINDACDAILNGAVASYPQSEVQTFDQQVAEVQSYRETGNPESAPLLSALAAARGITLDDLCERVIAKRAAFSVLSGCIIGQRQALEDRLDVLKTIEEIWSLPVNIHSPT